MKKMKTDKLPVCSTVVIMQIVRKVSFERKKGKIRKGGTLVGKI